jgi:hypothetical protein
LISGVVLCVLQNCCWAFATEWGLCFRVAQIDVQTVWNLNPLHLVSFDVDCVLLVLPIKLPSECESFPLLFRWFIEGVCFCVTSACVFIDITGRFSSGVQNEFIASVCVLLIHRTVRSILWQCAWFLCVTYVCVFKIFHFLTAFQYAPSFSDWGF